jgi:hypothetical protein
MFIEGDPNFASRSMKLNREYLQLQDNGRPRIRISTVHCRSLVWQMKHNHYWIDHLTGFVDDTKEAPRQKNDVRGCLEYWISRNPSYVAPPVNSQKRSNPYDEMKKAIMGRFRSTKSRETPYTSIGGAS